ncbi:Metabotropic glutamate receptor-like protein B [Frankliniella fusca]|uniref:Metabotropic glutamate receptor-like protein B n=1 Tax=Frankliniella fusca TaxID=407009 RepID=A0AAE1LUL7_9NEOP|nr:Metabotropic glutamate receptor-like protein B [Frankliniella fusca]
MERSGPVLLFEDDGVPGRKLDTRILDRYKNVQLQRWLECRKLPTTGNKKELQERILKRVKTGRGHILDVGVDAGKWLELKWQKMAGEVRPKKCYPITGWKPFPGFDIPQMFNEGHIYHYIVESVPRVLPAFLKHLTAEEDDQASVTLEDSGQESEEEDEPLAGSTEMLRKGHRYIKSRFVLSVRDKRLEDKYYLKAEVRASMKMEKEMLLLPSPQNQAVCLMGHALASKG